MTFDVIGLIMKLVFDLLLFGGFHYNQHVLLSDGHGLLEVGWA